MHPRRYNPADGNNGDGGDDAPPSRFPTPPSQARGRVAAPIAGHSRNQVGRPHGCCGMPISDRRTQTGTTPTRFCEIDAGSVSPHPDSAKPLVAREAIRRALIAGGKRMAVGVVSSTGWRWELVHPPLAIREGGRTRDFSSFRGAGAVSSTAFPWDCVGKTAARIWGDIGNTRVRDGLAQSIRGPSRALGHRVLERIVGLRREEWHSIPCQKHMCAQRLLLATLVKRRVTF